MRQSAPRHRPVRTPLLLSGCLVAGCSPGGAQPRTSQEHAFRVVEVASGLAHPWGIAFLPDGGMLVTERPGRLRLIPAGGGPATTITGVPAVRAGGQGGLLDVELHPDFATNRLVYLTWSRPGPGGATTALGRGRLEGAALTGFEELLVADAWSTSGSHFGSRIVFDRAGHLFIGIGDRGTMEDAQDRSNHAGTILRLHDDGRAPADNPFAGRTDVRAEIYAWGIRSPQGMALHPETGELWENEHGPRGGDEVNIIRAGRNYGWPTITYGVNYDGSAISREQARPGMEQPVTYYVPSIAISGMTFYTGDRFPRWRGNLFVGALAGQQVRRLVLDGDRVTHQEIMLSDLRQRVRQVKQGPDGLLYLLTDEANGAVLRLEP